MKDRRRESKKRKDDTGVVRKEGDGTNTQRENEKASV